MDSFTPLVTRRVFAAVEVPGDVIASFKDTYRKIKTSFDKGDVDMKWVPQEKWHVTLKFFGQSTEKAISIYSRAMRDIAGATAPFKLHVRGIGAFADISEARVVWLGVSNTKELRSIRDKIESWDGIAAPDEHAEFIPHISIGRLRNPKNVKSVASPFLRKDFFSFDVDRIALIESKMHNYNPVYEYVECFKLAGGV